jgi:hypothetical protein
MQRVVRVQVRSAIIFTSTCKACHLLSYLLEELGVACTALHSGKDQRRRLAALHRFRSGQVPLLLATDVASRGLDIPTVDLVVNFDLPVMARDYVHRCAAAAKATQWAQQVDCIMYGLVQQAHLVLGTRGSIPIWWPARELVWASATLCTLPVAFAGRSQEDGAWPTLLAGTGTPQRAASCTTHSIGSYVNVNAGTALYTQFLSWQVECATLTCLPGRLWGCGIRRYIAPSTQHLHNEYPLSELSRPQPGMPAWPGVLALAWSDVPPQTVLLPSMGTRDTLQ